MLCNICRRLGKNHHQGKRNRYIKLAICVAMVFTCLAIHLNCMNTKDNGFIILLWEYLSLLLSIVWGFAYFYLLIFVES